MPKAAQLRFSLNLFGLSDTLPGSEYFILVDNKEKKIQEEARIEPGSSCSASDCCINYTMGP